MGITVIGGLLLSTLLTLLIVPAGFSLAIMIEGWTGPRLRTRLLTFKPGDDRPTAEATEAAESEGARQLHFTSGAIYRATHPGHTCDPSGGVSTWGRPLGAGDGRASCRGKVCQ